MSSSDWKYFERLYKNKVTQDNFALIDRANNEIEKYIREIENFHKNPKLVRFDYNNYYDSLLVPLKIDDYIPLPPPNEKKLRKEQRCLKKNTLLEKIFKNRYSKRLERGKAFEEKWEELCEKYEKEENQHLKDYNANKEKLIQENKKEKDKILECKKKFEKNDVSEVEKLLIYYLNNCKLEEKTIGCNSIVLITNREKSCFQFEFCFDKPDDAVFDVKKYTYLKTKFETRETRFTEKEREKIYENIIFNSALYYISVISYAFYGKLNEVIVNCYVEGLNLANGKNEDKYIMSAIFNPNEINYDNLSLIDSKAFFDNVNAKYTLPLIELKKIIPYSIEKVDLLQYVDKDIDGFEFEKFSKQLLNSNGFEDVIVTQASGDYGADVIAYKDKIKYAIQCKKYSSKVGIKAVQEIIASREMYKCHIGAILTNNYFTPNAIKLADNNKILLWDRGELVKMIDNYNSKKNCGIQSIDFNDKNESMIDNKEIINDINEEHNNVKSENDELEQEMDIYNLSDEEKEEVRNGNYDSCDFEEDGELQDDDYYYEDNH